MENDDFSKIIRAFDDKTEPSSKFFMPDNFYDENANIINDFETVKKEHFVGDPALRPKNDNPSFNATNIKDNSISLAGIDGNKNVEMGNAFINRSINDESGDTVFNKLINGSRDNQSVAGSFDTQTFNSNIDTNSLFSPKFVETEKTDNSIFTSSGISQNFDSDSVSLEPVLSEEHGIVDDKNSDSSSTDFSVKTEFSEDKKSFDNEVLDNSDTSDNNVNINNILSNTLGVKFTTDDTVQNDNGRHELYDDLKPVELDASNKISGPSLDSNFTINDNNIFVDKTLSSHKEFSNLDLGRDIIGFNNQGDDTEEISGFSHNSQWHNLPKSTYKAGAVNVPVIIDEPSSSGIINNVSKVISNTGEDENGNVNDNDRDSVKTDFTVDSTNDENDDVSDSKNDVQSWINRILKVDNNSVKINSDGSVSDFNNFNSNSLDSKENINQSTSLDIEKFTKKEVDYDFSVKDLPVHKSDLLVSLEKKQEEENKISILVRYGEDFCNKDYITNPAIGRSNEIKQLILILLTPEKSGILVGKPGIGKTSIVEGLAYQLQRDNVPDALKGYTIVNVKTASLLGTLPSGETRLQTLIDELKSLDKVILFIDEIHMLIGATNESALDFANMFKEGLGRGKIKVIGATTTEEYERYILRDKAFVRRFQKVEVLEPNREHTIRILMGTLPKIEKTTNAKLKYDSIIQGRIMGFIVDITSEYKRIYGIGSRYPDICLTLLSQAFSQAVFDDRKEVNIFDIRNAIENSKNIYPDVIRKELQKFDKMFENVMREEQGLPPIEESTRF